MATAPQAAQIARQLVAGLTQMSNNIDALEITPQLIKQLRQLASAAVLMKESAESAAINFPQQRMELMVLCETVETGISMVFDAALAFEKNAADAGAKKTLAEGTQKIATATARLIDIQQDSVQEDILSTARIAALSLKHMFITAQQTESPIEMLVASAKRFAQSSLQLARVLQTKSADVTSEQWQSAMERACSAIRAQAPKVVVAAKAMFAAGPGTPAAAELRAQVSAMSKVIAEAIEAGVPPPGATTNAADAAVPDFTPALGGSGRIEYGDKRKTVTNPKHGQDVLKRIKSVRFQQEVESMIDKEVGEQQRAETAGGEASAEHAQRLAREKQRMEAERDVREAEARPRLVASGVLSSEPAKETADEQHALSELSNVKVIVKPGGSGLKAASTTGGEQAETWDCERVKQWLTQLDIPEVTDAIPKFMENEIDGEALLELDQDDLKQMGVQKLGSLKKFFKNRNQLL